MSTDDQLFFDPGHREASRAAQVVAEAIGGRYLDNDAGVGIVVSLDRSETDTFVVGPVWVNSPIQPLHPEDPADREIFDAFPLLWSMRVGPQDGTPTDPAAIREVFDRLVRSGLGWSLVLAHNFGELIATYDLERGVRTFPPGTSSDGTDEHLWG